MNGAVRCVQDAILAGVAHAVGGVHGFDVVLQARLLGFGLAVGALYALVHRLFETAWLVFNLPGVYACHALYVGPDLQVGVLTHDLSL